MASQLSFEDLIPKEGLDTLQELRQRAQKAAFDLLVELNSRATKESWHEICTSESLTAGLMMSTLVDIPFGGYLKYGCFGVYDTDAKRVFNSVAVDDVYTHRCAKEMAIGILKNSNATLAIAVTGNAMPLNDHADMLSEVFIGIAGYKENKIIYETISINGCNETDIDDFKKLCKTWHSTIVNFKKYNPRDRTALISQYIRYHTVSKALENCLVFVKKHDPEVPDFILKRKEKNAYHVNKVHTQLPSNKYEEGLEEICVHDETCSFKNSTDRVNTKLFLRGGKVKNKTKKRLRRG